MDVYQEKCIACLFPLVEEELIKFFHNLDIYELN